MKTIFISFTSICLMDSTKLIQFSQSFKKIRDFYIFIVVIGLQKCAEINANKPIFAQEVLEIVCDISTKYLLSTEI